MWLCAWLCAKKGVEMGVGWGERGLHFQSRGNRVEEGEFPKCLGIPKLKVHWGYGTTLGDPGL